MLIKNVKCDSNWERCNRRSAWHKITAHTWSGAYLLGSGGAHFRRFAKVLSKMLRVPFAGYLNRRVSEWSNSSNGPPLYPLKYGTPRRYFIGDAGWNPI
jgi:hypothetical protein